MTADSWTVAVSIVALVVSVGSAISAARTSKGQLKLEAQQARTQEDLLAVELSREHDRVKSASQAVLRAALRRDPASVKLQIVNVGSANAYAVHVKIDGIPIAKHPLFSARKPEPVEKLGPGGRIGYRMLTHDGMHTQYVVTIMWDDKSGQERHWESALSIDGRESDG